MSQLNTNDFSQSPRHGSPTAENDRGAGVKPSPTGPNPLVFPHICRDCGQTTKKPYPFGGHVLCAACLYDATNPDSCGLYAQLEGSRRA